MKSAAPLIAISQRVDIVPGRHERRDALDQRWWDFLAACGFLAVPIPNRSATVPELMTRISPVGVLLSGGNDIAALGGDAPERDEAERAMVAWAVEHGVAVLGVCRGLEMIAHIFGARLERISGHVGTNHDVQWRGRDRRVNSFHTWGLIVAPADFEVTARASDGSIEALQHRERKIAGVMWHPEREAPFSEHDIDFVRNYFGGPS